MKVNDGLKEELLKKISNYREMAPVFRIRIRSINEMERDAMNFARNFLSTYTKVETEIELHQSRDKNTTLFNLAEGGRLRLYHPSGTMVAKQNMSPFDKMITEDLSKEELTSRTNKAMKRLQLGNCPENERLEFERLWKIKTRGMSQSGELGKEFLCHAVGAFRRYLHGLPVWGRASVFVEIAENDVIDSAGIDWRPVIEDPIDNVNIIALESAADRILGELKVGIPGGEITTKDFLPDKFSLGYYSLAKRRVQSHMQPVFVATFIDQGQTSLNRMVVIPATLLPYQPICRILEPPRKIEHRNLQATAPSSANKTNLSMEFG